MQKILDIIAVGTLITLLSILIISAGILDFLFSLFLALLITFSLYWIVRRMHEEYSEKIEEIFIIKK